MDREARKKLKAHNVVKPKDLVGIAIEKLQALTSTADNYAEKIDIFIDYGGFDGGHGIRITLQNTDSFHVEKERLV